MSRQEAFAAAQTCPLPQRRVASIHNDFGEPVKALLATAIGTATLLVISAAFAANARPEGYGAAWLPLLFTVVVFSLVMWVLSQMARERMEGQEE